MHPRRNPNLNASPFLAAIALAATALLGFAAGDRDARRSVAQQAAIAIESAALRQGVDSLEFVVKVSEPLTPKPAPAVAGGRICVTNDLRTVRRELHKLCVARSHGNWKLTTPSRGTAGVRVRVTGKTARFTIDRIRGGIAPGITKWHVDSSSTRCEFGSSAATGETESDVAADCPARLPVTGKRHDRVKRVETTGCKVHGHGTITRGSARSKRIALGFDDGPSVHTDDLLDKLAARNAKATFYMLGGQISSHAKLVRRMLAEGHEPANHSWSHSDLSGGGGGAAGQLARTNAAIRHASRFTPCTFRPPYGATSGALVASARARGLATVTWSVDPQDWRGIGTNAIVERVVSNAHPGAIVVLHDGGGNRSATLAAVPQIIDRLQARGYRFVSVAEILGGKFERRLAR